MSKFQRKRMADGLLTGLKQAVVMEESFLACRREVILKIDEKISHLKSRKPETSYERRKYLNQLEVLEEIRCTIRNYVNP